MAANDKYNSIKESTLSAFFSTLKAFFWKAADVVNVTLGQAAVKDVDSTPTASSTNLVESGGVQAALANKQDTLTIDNSVTKSSTNPVKSSGVYDAVNPAVVNHGTSDTTYSITPNVLHIWGEVASLTLTLATPSDNTIENEYKFRFESGSTATTLSLPVSVVYDESKGDLIPEADKIYEVSIVDNIALWIAVDNS